MGPDCLNHDIERIETALLQRTIDTLQHRSRVDSRFALVYAAVLEHHHSRTNSPFRMIVARRHPLELHEREQISAVSMQRFGQTTSVLVRPFLNGQIAHPSVQRRQTLAECVERQGISFGFQSDGIAINPQQSLGKLRPVALAFRTFNDLFQFSQQAVPALLFGSSDNVVRFPEVRHQDAMELLDEEPIEFQMTMRFVDHVIAGVLRAGASQPPCLTFHTPSSFIAVQYVGIQTQAVDLFVPRTQHIGQPVPHPRQSAIANLEFQMVVEDCAVPLGLDTKSGLKRCCVLMYKTILEPRRRPPAPSFGVSGLG